MKRWSSIDVPITARPSERLSYLIMPMHNHQEHEINIALRGEGLYHLDDGRTLKVSGGEVVLLPAGRGHGIEVHHGMSTRVILFHASFFERLGDMANGAEELRGRLTGWTDPPAARRLAQPNVFDRLLSLYEQVAAEMASGDPFSAAEQMRLGDLVAIEFLRLLQADESEDSPDSTTRRVLTVKSWIDRHFAESVSLGDLAARAHFSPSHFSAAFVKVVGMSPMAYVKSRRMEQARHLLSRTEMPVREIAFSVGFRQVGHFNHLFKDTFGESPLEHRKKWQSGAQGSVGE